MRPGKAVFVWLVVASLLAGLVGCTKPAETPGASAPADQASPQPNEAAQAKQLRVGVAAASFAHEWVDWQLKGIDEIAAQFNVQVQKTDAQWDYSKQVSHVETFLQSGVDGIIIILGEAASVTKAAAKAKDAGVPVVFVDGGLLAPGVVTNVSSDNIELGRMTARYIAEQLGGKGNVVIFHAPMEEVSRRRVKGAKEVFAEFPGMQVVEEHVIAAENETERAREITEGLILKYRPGELGAVWAAWDGMALGAAAALDEKGRSEVVVTTIDGTRAALQLLKTGSTLRYAIAQRPREMGRIAMEMLLRAIAGERTPPIEVLVPAQAYVKDTAPADDIGVSGE